jgi:hypothetical protein
MVYELVFSFCFDFFIDEKKNKHKLFIMNAPVFA